MNMKNTLMLIAIVLIVNTIIIAETGYVSRIVDGDTFVLSSGSKVRLIGVDTPESKHPRKPVEYYSAEATQFLKELIENKFIYYEYGDERTDRYGRLLCYVWIDSILVNQAIIATGHGMAYLKYPHKYEDEFLISELYARRNGVGMWGGGTLSTKSNLQTTKYSSGTTSIHALIYKYRLLHYSDATILEECEKGYPVDSCKSWVSINSLIKHYQGLQYPDSLIYQKCIISYPEDSCKACLKIE